MKSPVERLSGSGDLAIFLFHGVIEQATYNVRNYTRKHLPVTEFRTVVEELARIGEPLSMDQVLDFCNEGTAFPRGAFAVTFDDGFENNLSVARPILEALKVPATVYVTSKFIEKNAMSWIDRIEWALEVKSTGALDLPWETAPSSFANTPDKIRLLDQIRAMVKTRREIDTEKFVSDIFRQLELDPVQSSDDPLDRKMTWRQVREWHTGNYIVGGHSHTHAILSFLTPDELNWEVDSSLNFLRDRTDIVARHYSYPEGLAHCYSLQVIGALKTRGIVCSPTAIDGTNSPGADPFHLRRVMVA